MVLRPEESAASVSREVRQRLGDSQDLITAPVFEHTDACCAAGDLSISIQAECDAMVPCKHDLPARPCIPALRLGGQ